MAEDPYAYQIIILILFLSLRSIHYFIGSYGSHSQASLLLLTDRALLEKFFRCTAEKLQIPFCFQICLLACVRPKEELNCSELRNYIRPLLACTGKLGKRERGPLIGCSFLFHIRYSIVSITLSLCHSVTLSLLYPSPHRLLFSETATCHAFAFSVD